MRSVDDGAHIIYVNGAYQGNDAIGRLMADFNNPNYATMYYVQLQQRCKYLKEEKGEENMCAFTQEVLDMGRVEGLAIGKAEGEARGRAEGKAEGILESVRNLMVNLKMSAQSAMDVLNVPAADRSAILAAL